VNDRLSVELANAGLPFWHRMIVALIGFLAGAAGGMDMLAGAEDPTAYTKGAIIGWVAGSAAALALVSLLIHAGTARMIRRLDLPQAIRNRLHAADMLTYLIVLATFLGALGVQFTGPAIAVVIFLFIAAKAVALCAILSREQRSRMFSSLGYLAFLFLVSGFAALIYQIVWQRTLFAAFGVNIESITVIVSLFMFGLGIGSMVGGILSLKFPERGPLLFLTCELGIGAFGMVSLPLIDHVATLTLHGSLLMVSLAVYALLCLPTMLMGATLPILVSHLYRHYRNVGKSVGILYCINTVGSAIACFITADLLFIYLGQQGAVYVAAMCNIAVGVLVSRYAAQIARQAAVAGPEIAEQEPQS
jgi:spermidine synthase